MSDDPIFNERQVFRGSSFTDRIKGTPIAMTWQAMVNLAAAIVEFDKTGGKNCDYISVHVMKERPATDYDNGNIRVPMHLVNIEISMPAKLSGGALRAAGVAVEFEHDDKLGDDQATRFALLELD